MDEEEKKKLEEETKRKADEEAKKKADEDAAKNSDAGSKSSTISELDRADQIAERQKRENDRREELLTREENLAARKAIGGITEAGKEPDKPKEETDEEFVEKFKQGEVNLFEENAKQGKD